MSQLANIKISGVGYADLVAASIIPKDTPAAQVQIFAAVCAETGLSATKKEIYLINNGGKFYNIVSIGGFRSLAEKTGTYMGKTEVMYDRKADGTYSTIADYEVGKFPKSATITIYKNVGGVKCEFTASIATREYLNGYMAKQMPFTMVNKVVEVHALRSAYASLHNFFNEDEVSAIKGETEAAQKTVIEHKPKEKAILDANHQDWEQVVAFMKKQNGETTEAAFARLKNSYTLNETVIETLTKFVPLHNDSI
jgi:hypothetical protein